ncbi:MAG: DUF4199 domain-containing protein [Gemmatimonadaceae bacterium]
MRRIVLTYGLLAGALLSAMMAVSMSFIDRIGHDRGMVVGYTSMVLAFLFVYFGVRSYRDTAGGGSIGFGRALGVGLLIALVTSLCYVATWEVMYFGGFVPDFAANYTAHVLAKAKAAGATAESLARQAREMEELWKSYQNPLVNVAYTFLEVFPVGLVMSLVSAGLLRSRRGTETRPAGVESTSLAM